MSKETSHSHIVDDLRFQHDAGVTIAIGEMPVDWFAQAEKALSPYPRQKQEASHKLPEAAQVKSQDQSPSTAQTVSPLADRIAISENLAAEAKSLEELREAVHGFDGCDLIKTARNTVFADGNPQARLMIVGEAPGNDEDIQGLPFVGRSGQLLDRMLAAIHIDRSKCLISNILPWRPPGNRKPSPEEVALCLPFIKRHIELVQPEFLFLLGGVSASALLNTTTGITRLRGQWHELKVAGRIIPVLPSFHPSYLLRSPAQKRIAWHDFLNLAEAMDK